MLKVNMKNKENYQDLFGIAFDKKVLCAKPDYCSFIVSAVSSSFVPSTEFIIRRLKKFGKWEGK